jgi:hypothetical protein
MKIPFRFKALFHSISACTYLFGTVWWVYDRFVRVPGILGAEHHPAQHWWIRFHSFFAYALLVSFGYLIKLHIEPGLRGTKRKKSGWLLIGTFAALSLSAFPVLYATDGWLRDASSFVHTYLGLLCPLFLIIHLRARLTALSRVSTLKA